MPLRVFSISYCWLWVFLFYPKVVGFRTRDPGPQKLGMHKECVINKHKMTSTFYLLSIFHKESESLLSCVSLIISSHSDQSRFSCSVQCGHPSPVLWKRMLLWDLCPRALGILTPLRSINILLLIWSLAASYPLTWLVLFHSLDAYMQLSGVVDRCGQREWRNASRTGQIAAPSSYKTIRLITQPMACEEFCSKSLSETFLKTLLTSSNLVWAWS